MEYAIHRNGRPVAGFGLGTPTEAEAALHSIRVRLDRPPWLRGVSVTETGDAVLVQVERPEHVPIARVIVGDRVGDVPVLYEAVGDVVAALAGIGVGHPEPPTPPASHPSPWKYAVVMSVASAATGWVLEEIARRTFRKSKGRR